MSATQKLFGCKHKRKGAQEARNHCFSTRTAVQVGKIIHGERAVPYKLPSPFCHPYPPPELELEPEPRQGLL